MASIHAPDFSINSDSAASLFGRFATGGYFVPVPDFFDTLNHSWDAVSIDGACVNTLNPSLLSHDQTSEMNDMSFLENTYESAIAPKWNMFPFKETGNDQQSQSASSTSRSSSMSSLSSSSDFPPESGLYSNQVISGLKELETSLSEQLAEDMKTCFRQTESPKQQKSTQFGEESMSSCGSGKFVTKEPSTDPQTTLTQICATKPGRKRGRKPSGLSAEEKRKKRLEKGRLAANKCRAKKRKLEVDLEFIEQQLLEERKQLLQLNESLKREIGRLQAEVARKADFVQPKS